MAAGVAAAVAATLALPAPGGAQETGLDLPVREVALDNGMRILILPRPGVPTVSLVVQYGVGSVHEHLGVTGIAHVLEHMLFKGTTTIGTHDLDAERRLFQTMDAVHDTLLAERAHPAPDSTLLAELEERIGALEDEARRHVVSNEFDRILTRHGARGLNATTDVESTTYYVELPANRLEVWFALEADRMSRPVFREFYAERDVVMEERRMRVETSPGGKLYEAHLAAAYRMHPYGVPVVGWASDLATLTREDVAEYYRRFYGPNNAVVAIVGDVDPERTERLARRWFGPIPPGEEPPPVLAVEPPQEGEIRVDVVFDAEPSVRMGWHVVDAFHPDMPALVALSAVLTGGRTSRLYRRLVVEERIATYVGASLGPGQRFPGLFQIDAVPRAPHTTAEVEAAVYEELERLAREAPEDRELVRVRNQIEAGAVRRLTSSLGLAFQLAGSETLWGDWRQTFRLSRRIAEVAPEDVRRVTERYFRATNRSVATLVKPAAASPDTVAGGAR